MDAFAERVDAFVERGDAFVERVDAFDQKNFRKLETVTLYM